MKREIIFRGKRIKEEDPFQRWITGTLATWTDRYGDKRTCIVSRSGYHNEVYPETVGQHTGLIDRHGHGIYEGDIVEIITYYSLSDKEMGRVRRVVTYDQGYGAFKAGDYMMTCAPNMEVIGNIHDNPQLLK